MDKRYDRVTLLGRERLKNHRSCFMRLSLHILICTFIYISVLDKFGIFKRSALDNNNNVTGLIPSAGVSGNTTVNISNGSNIFSRNHSTGDGKKTIPVKNIGANNNTSTKNRETINNSTNVNNSASGSETNNSSGINTDSILDNNGTLTNNAKSGYSAIIDNGTNVNNSTNSTAGTSEDPIKNINILLYSVLFNVKSAWPVNNRSLEADIATAFYFKSLIRKYTNLAVHVTNLTCLWSCPRSKRSLQDENIPGNFETGTFGNNIVFTFVPTYGDGKTPTRLTTRTIFKYNNYLQAQKIVLESSAVQVIFVVFQGVGVNRSAIDAVTVASIFKKYGSLHSLNTQLKTVDEVLTFPIPYQEFLIATEPPPVPPSPSSTLLIPSWAIFLLVFVSFLILLFVIWIVYSCMTGTLKNGGASTLVGNLKKDKELQEKGPLTHPYNINIHKQETEQTQAPTPAAKTARTIRFDRSTSYDVGLLPPREIDKEAPLRASPYKRKESRVQEAAVKKKVRQRKQTETTFFPTYKPKFTRLNSLDKLPRIAARDASFPPSDTHETYPLSVNDQRTNRDFLSGQSDMNEHVPKKRKDLQTLRRKRKQAKRNVSSSNSESALIIPTPIDQLFYPKAITPYPIFQPLNLSPSPYTAHPAYAGHPYQFANTQFFYPNATLQVPPSIPSASHNGSPKLTRSSTGEDFEDGGARNERFRKMARELLDDAFDDSGFSTNSLGNKNAPPEKPTDMEEFRKILDEAFAFSKRNSS